MILIHDDLGSPCTVSNSLSYNTITNHSIQYSSLISLLHSLYSHRSNNSIVSATQNLCRHQRRIKTHKIYIRGIITLYVSSTVILFHLQRGCFVPHYKISVQLHPPSIPYIYPPTGSSTMYLEQPSWIHYTHHLIHQRSHPGCYHQRLIQLCSQIRQGKFELKHTQSNCCISSP